MGPETYPYVVLLVKVDATYHVAVDTINTFPLMTGKHETRRIL
jgi:hypothetical protein